MAAAVALVGLLGVRTSRSALAQDAGATSSWEAQCNDVSTVMEMNKCSRLRYEVADSLLTIVYHRALETVEDTGLGEVLEQQWKEGLKEAQRMWEELREADCGLVSTFEWRGGSGATGAEYACLATVTEQRTTLLRSRYLNGG